MTCPPAGQLASLSVTSWLGSGIGSSKRRFQPLATGAPQFPIPVWPDIGALLAARLTDE